MSSSGPASIVFPMRGKTINRIKRRVEVASETNRPVVDEDVSSRLPVRDARYEMIELIGSEPAPDVLLVPSCKDHHLIPTAPEGFKKLAGASSRRIEMIGSFPARVGIEDAVQVDADDRRFRPVRLPGRVLIVSGHFCG